MVSQGQVKTWDQENLRFDYPKWPDNMGQLGQNMAIPDIYGFFQSKVEDCTMKEKGKYDDKVAKGTELSREQSS